MYIYKRAEYTSGQDSDTFYIIDDKNVQTVAAMCRGLDNAALLVARLNTLSFQHFRAANELRLRTTPKYEACLKWSVSDWFMAIVGEMGEAANYCKKVLRDQNADFSNPHTQKELGRELADVVTYIDLLASMLGINLGEAVRDKFNDVSHRVNSKVML